MVRPSGRAERYCVYRSLVPSIPMHFHSMAEITLIQDGEGTLHIGNHSLRTTAGTLAFAPPNVLHGQTQDQPSAKWVCMFDLGMIEPLLARDHLFGHLRSVGDRFPPAVNLSPADHERVAATFSALLAERESLQLGGGAVACALITQLLVHFLRSATDPVRDELTSGPIESTSPPDDYARVLAHLWEHFTEPVNRASVARDCGLRPEAVSRMFQQATGESFTTNLSKLRLGHALELMQSTSLSLAEIATRSGFDSYRTFSRTFVHHHGQSPTSYRSTLATTRY